MKREIIYSVKRTIESEDVVFGGRIYSIYKETVKNPSKEYSIEGICNKEQMDIINIDEPIKNIDMVLLLKDVEQAFKTYLNGEKERDISKYLIEKPYSYIKEHGTNSVDLYNYDASSQNLFNANGEVLPKAIYIDYMYWNGNMVETRFNLEAVLEELKTKNNIRFIEETEKKY